MGALARKGTVITNFLVWEFAQGGHVGVVLGVGGEILAGDY